MDGRSWPRADLRVGDADRQAVVAELQRHYVDGRLNSDELGERAITVWSAKTFADLAVPLADLPVLPKLALAEPTPQTDPDSWGGHSFGPPLAAVLVMVGLMLMLVMFAGPHHLFGVLPFWPLLIWGFVFVGIGRPPRSGRGSRWRHRGPPTDYQ